jgi:peptidylprolyl isomerase
MRMLATLLSTLLATSGLAMSVLAADPPKVKSMQDILDAAPASAWRTLDPDNTLYLQLASGRVVIELATSRRRMQRTSARWRRAATGTASS